MVYFDVYLNGSKICRAGGSRTMLLADVRWVNHPKGTNIFLGASGMTREWDEGSQQESQHETWAHQKVAVGDEITIRVIESDSADSPLPQPIKDHPEFERRMARGKYQRLKRQLADLERK